MAHTITDKLDEDMDNLKVSNRAHGMNGIIENKTDERITVYSQVG